MAIYGYIRVSTGRQVSEGQSLDAQETMVRGLAMANGGSLSKTYREEGVSGSVHLHDRPEGSNMLRELKNGDTVIATRLDRLFRSALDALQCLDDFQKKDIRVIFGDIGDTNSTNGKLLLTILAGVAEAERNIIRERIRAVKRAQNGEGRYLGGRAPFGYEIVRAEGEAAGGKLTLTPEGAAARAEIVQLRAEGKSLRTIAEAMSAKGWAISHGGVKDVLAAESAKAGEAKADA